MKLATQTVDPWLDKHSAENRTAARGRFAPNLLANIGHLGFSMLIGIWYVPYLVTHLGPGAYGLVPLTSSITAYMLLVTMSLNSAVARSMAAALEHGDIPAANRIFNTSFWGSVALCGLLLVPAVLGLLYLDRLIRIPPGYESQARWLFAGVAAAFLLNEFKTPFDVSSFCRNRFDLRNLVSMCDILTRVSLVVILFTFSRPALAYVGSGIAGGALISAAGAVWLWRTLTPNLRVAWRDFDIGILRNLTHTGGWVVVSTLGSFLYLNLDLVVANHLFSAEQSGRYAAILQLVFFLRLFSNAVSGLFTPNMLALYARHNTEGRAAATPTDHSSVGGANGRASPIRQNTDELLTYLRRSIRFSGLVLALPVGLLCGFAEPLLRLWLGGDFAPLAPLLFVLAFHLCVNLSMQPLYALPLAADRVKVPGLVALAIGAANVALALLLAGYFGWGLYGLAIPGAIMLSIRHLVFTPLYSARILKQPAASFYRQVVPIILATTIAIALCRVVVFRWSLSDWPQLIAAAAGVSILFAAILYVIFLKPEERAEIKSMCGQFRSSTVP